MTMKNARPLGENEASRAGLSDFVAWVTAYKELLLAGAAIVGSVLLVKDYFATKSDVAILKCQLHAEIELTDSRVRIAESTRRLVTLNHDLARVAAPRPASESAAKLGMEIHKETAALTAQTARETEAEAKLRSGACRDEGSRVSPGGASRV